MDVSEQYIKMCEKAEEIQGLAKERRIPPRKGIFYIEQDAYAHIELPDTGDLVYKYKSIWLPRQDQLQEIYSDSGSDFGLQTLCIFMYDFAISEYGSRFTINGSMEQLWLAFVVKERYGKVWSGEEWLVNE